MSQTTCLIVDQQQQPAENLPELLKELAQKHQLDIYQSRQRLVGRGLSLLTKGDRDSLTKISRLLLQNGFTHWLVEPSKPQFVPHRIRSLDISAEKITFSCQKKQIVFPKSAAILAVFAEMSGDLAEKSVKQLLSSHAYRGRDDVRHLEEHKVRKIILQGNPLLDLYLLDEQKQIIDAVRVFPGKFDPKGLGERATVSSKQNLDRVLKLAEEYAGDFTLVTDFGLVNLPGCSLRRENPDDPETQRQNQISLARYGWLLADLERTEAISPAPPEQQADEMTGSVAAAILMQSPTLVANGQLEQVMPVAREIAKEIDQAETEKKNQPTDPAIAEAGLPAPPDAKQLGAHTHPLFWLGSAGAALAVGVMFFAEVEERLLRTFFKYFFATGAFTLLLAGLFFWGGFYFIRLKRQMENTPTSKVRSVAMGMVEVKGRAVRQYALISPMSHVPCVYYRLTKYHREDNKQWTVTSISSSDNVPFYLEDDTGQISIDPSGCKVRAGTKQEGAPGQVGLTRFEECDDKWVEEIIVESTLLYVLGFASVKREQGPTLTEQKIEALRELKRNPQNLQQFDSDGDGKISEDEWEAARTAVEEKVLHESLKNRQRRKKQQEHVVIGKQRGRPLVIAETHSEASLTSRFAFYTVPLFIAAITATGFGISQLINFFG